MVQNGCLMDDIGADLRGEAAGGESLKSGEGMLKDPVGIFMQTMLRFPKPIVAAVNGQAIGVGTTLVPHCDVAFCSSSATFWTPFSRIAVVPEFCSTILFPRIMGKSVANEMILLGKKIDAETAKRVGLVSDVFPAGPDFLTRVIKEVRNGMVYPLLDKTFPIFKHMMNYMDHKMLDDVCAYELSALDERANAGDVMEAVIEFMQSQKKKPSKL